MAPSSTRSPRSRTYGELDEVELLEVDSPEQTAPLTPAELEEYVSLVEQGQAGALSGAAADRCAALAVRRPLTTKELEEYVSLLEQSQAGVLAETAAARFAALGARRNVRAAPQNSAAAAPAPAVEVEGFGLSRAKPEVYWQILCLVFIVMIGVIALVSMLDPGEQMDGMGTSNSGPTPGGVPIGR